MVYAHEAAEGRRVKVLSADTEPGSGLLRAFKREKMDLPMPPLDPQLHIQADTQHSARSDLPDLYDTASAAAQATQSDLDAATTSLADTAPSINQKKRSLTGLFQVLLPGSRIRSSR